MSRFMSHLIKSLKIMVFMIALPLDASSDHAVDSVAATAEKHEIDLKGCKNIGKINKIDDFFFQAYSNLDSHCLFEIPGEDLEKIWSIPVQDYIRAQSMEEKDKINTRWRENIRNENTLYVRILDLGSQNRPDIFQIYVSSTDSYARSNQGGFAESALEGKYPPGLPPAQIKRRKEPVEDNPPPPYDPNFIPLPRKPPEQSVYEPWTFAYWMNAGQDPEKPILLFEFSKDKLPDHSSFYSKARYVDIAH